METTFLAKTKALTVSELTLQIKRQLGANFATTCVEGEISNCKRHTSGHLYFSIKDENAQLNCVMFKSSVDKLATLPKEGDQVRLFGQIDVYLPRGSYQLVVKKLEFSGVGALLLKFEEMKKKLQSMGYFDQEKKKKLPPFPKTIGIVTSPTGAVIQDILHILRKRSKQFHILIHPVHVQGDVAAAEIADAIRDFNETKIVNVIIVARGGGSIEDLWAFNEKVVADAIFASDLPIISAVGHEVDFTISDFVADVRAPTPSGAAQIVLPETMQLETFLQTAQARLSNTLQLLSKQMKAKLRGLLSQPLLASSEQFLLPFQQKIDDREESLKQAILNFLERKKHALALAHQNLKGLQPKAQIVILKQRSAAYKTRLYERSQDQLQKKKASFEKTKQFLVQKQMELAKRIQEKQAATTTLKHLIGARLSSIVKNHLKRFETLKQHLHDISPQAIMDKGYALIYAQKENSIILGVNEMEQNMSVSIAMKDGKANALIKGIENE